MKKFIALFLSLACTIGAFSTGTVAEETTENPTAVDSQANEEKSTASVILANTIEENGITFVDGGQEDRKSSTYNEKVMIDGVEARKVYSGNHVYLKLDESFYDVKEDHGFFINLTFYQFGPERGTFTLQYASQSGVGSVTIIKEKEPMWMTKQVYIGDAYFNHTIDDVKADIKIVSGAFNAFAKVEVINAKSIKYDNEFDVGEVSAEHADTLYQLGIYSSSKDDAQSELAKPMTKAIAAAKIVKMIGRDREAQGYSSGMSGATPEENCAIGYLQAKEYINWSGDATEPISQIELVEVFEKIQGISIDGDIIQNAIDKQLLQKTDMMIQPNKAAKEDNLVALGYNWLFLTGKYGKRNLVNMMTDGLIDENKIKASSENKVNCFYYAVPRTLDKKEIVDSTTGRKYYHIDRGSQLVRDYYTANLWALDNKRFLVEDEDGGEEIFLYDTEKNTLQLLCLGNHPSIGKTTGKMYYFDWNGEKVRRIDLNTLVVETVADFYPGYRGGWGSSMTDDEKYLTINAAEYESELDLRTPFGGFRQRKTPTLNVETGEWDRTFHKEFYGGEADSMVLNHVILNPKYDNLIFFAHEGTAEKTPDRIWLLDRNTNEAFNLFRQKQRTDIITGEPAGHEMWFGNGERLAFVKYPKATNLCYSGIMTIDLTGKHKEYLNSDYRYWHCSASPANDRFVVADTNNIVNGTIEIVLIDRYTGQSTLLCKPYLGKTQHPGHAHPSFSVDGKKVNFVVDNGDGVIATAWMDISDLVENAPEGSRVPISDICEVPSYKGTVNYIEEKNKGGEDCYKVPAQKKMLVGVKDEKYQGDRVDATITFSYYDEGYTPVKLTYFGWNKSSMFLDKTEQMRYEITRRNTKKWKTATVELKDINLDNMEYIGTDFRIEGTYSDVYIKDLNVEVTNVISDFMDQLPWNIYHKPAEEQQQ